MERYLKALLALGSILGAALLLAQSVRLIEKNTPSEKKYTVKNLPPTAPVSTLSKDPQSGLAFVGGVGIV